MNASESNTLLIDCNDAKGLVYKITDIIYKNNLNIIENREFVEHDSKHFFMRTEVEGALNEEKLMEGLEEVLPEDSNIRLKSKEKKKVVILATKEHHVLGDLLIRNEFNENSSEVLAVVSNHEVLKPFVDRFDVPYHYITHENKSRQEHEAEVLEVLAEYDPDYLLLAKYMRILNPEFIDAYKDRIINIHHSFLPAFIGAKPYQQAYERAVKIIGATAHYVTDNLDEGPIIYQSTTRVDHSYSVHDMTQAGREIESQVMAEAVKLVMEDKIFIHGNRTVILD